MITESMRSKGFTLVELMIVVVVVAILAAIAYPTYEDSVRKARRSQAITSLETIRFAEEKWRVDNTTYTGTLGAGGLGLSATSPEGADYGLAITANSGTGFTATATPNSSRNQNLDTACGTFTVNQDGPVGSDEHLTLCWKR